MDKSKENAKHDAIFKIFSIENIFYINKFSRNTVVNIEISKDKLIDCHIYYGSRKN